MAARAKQKLSQHRHTTCRHVRCTTQGATVPYWTTSQRRRSLLSREVECWAIFYSAAWPLTWSHMCWHVFVRQKGLVYSEQHVLQAGLEVTTRLFIDEYEKNSMNRAGTNSATSKRCFVQVLDWWSVIDQWSHLFSLGAYLCYRFSTWIPKPISLQKLGLVIRSFMMKTRPWMVWAVLRPTKNCGVSCFVDRMRAQPLPFLISATQKSASKTSRIGWILKGNGWQWYA